MIGRRSKPGDVRQARPVKKKYCDGVVVVVSEIQSKFFFYFNDYQYQDYFGSFLNMEHFEDHTKHI